MTSSPSLLVNLGTTSAANVLAASPRPGVTGTLPIANGGTGATTASNARTSLGVPPTSHASSKTTYGVSSSSNYGHVRLSDSTTSTSSVTGGYAATPAAVKAVKDSIPKITYGTSAPPSTGSEGDIYLQI